MNTKNTVLLLIIALAVVAAVIYQKKKDESTFKSAAIPEQTIPAVTSGTLERITIDPPDQAAVTLTRSSDKWFTNVGQQYEADENAVTAAIKSVSEPIPATVVSSNPDSFDEYQVSETSATRVAFYNKGESKPDLALLVGKDGPSAFSTYVRLADGKDVLNAKASLSMTFKRPDGWRDHQIFQFSGSNATKVATNGTSATFTVAKSAEDKWMFEAPQTGEAESARVTSLANMLGSLRANEFIDPSSSETLETFGLEPAHQTVALTYEDKSTSPSKDVTVTLLIGRQTKLGGDWYAKRANKNDIFTIGNHVATALTPDPNSIKVKAPEPPAETPAPDAETTGAETIGQNTVTTGTEAAETVSTQPQAGNEAEAPATETMDTATTAAQPGEATATSMPATTVTEPLTSGTAVQ